MIHAIALSLSALLPIPQGDRPGYDFELLSTPAGGTSTGQALAAEGPVGGWCRNQGGSIQACLWIDGVRQLLGGTNVVAMGRSGLAVLTDSSNFTISYRYDYRTGTYDLLPALLGGQTYPRDVNSFGFAVGISSDTLGGSPTMAVRWDRNAVPLALGNLGGAVSDATAINDRGWIVGVSEQAGSNKPQPFIWQAGVMRKLAVLPGHGQGYALDVNNRGIVVGQSRVGSTRLGVYWIDGKGVPEPLGPAANSATAINDRGQILATGNGKPLLWVGGKLFRIEDLSQPPKLWKFKVARDLDEQGRITGEGVDKFGRTRAFLMTPKAANLNLDATLDRADVTLFATAYLRRSRAADLNADGRVDAGDVRAFLTAFRS